MNDPVDRVTFWVLADWWHADTDALSIDKDAFQHPAYLRIVNVLGESAIPYILEDLRDRRGHWYDALRKLTHAEPDADADNIQAARNAWLEWGRSQGKL